MPVCPQCDNRQFSNKEALLQHMRSSSAWHPFCSSCDRRFVSQTAYEAHMAAKHPPTFDCTVCNRPYHAPFALEDHYRGSSAHPNCTKCGRGFRDQPACEEHRRTAHPTSSCAPCGGRVFYNDELDQHYLDSINHPSCTSCTRGFKDDTAYVEHMSTAHPEQHCGTCNANFETPEALQAHFWSSPAHPKCDQCNVGFQNSEGRQFHLETVHTPTVTAAPTTDPTVITLNTIEEVKLDEIQAPPHPPPPPAQEPENLYSTGFTPLSPRHPMQRLIVGERRIDSPDLRLDLGFSSPITDVKPLFSPTVLPRPGGKIEELWSSTENVQVAPARVNHFTPSVPRNFDPYTRTTYHTHPGDSSSSSGWLDSARSVWRPRESRHISPPRISPPHSEFHPRLYPGSARAASMSRQGPLSESSFGRGGRLQDDFPSSSSHRSLGSSSVGSGSSSYSGFGRSRTTVSELVNWKELMGGKQDTSPFSSKTDLRASLFSETLTPKAELPDPTSSSGSQMQGHLSVQPYNLMGSPSLATVSSPASSALGHSPVGSSAHYEPDTRPTTASSPRTPSLLEVTYTVTPSSECASPVRSPEVTSPIGLRALPSLSPLASTPVDISFDIPEARQPLPESPTEVLSPVTIVVDLKPPQELTPPVIPQSASPLSTSSSQSYITSPQEPAEDIFQEEVTETTSTTTFPLEAEAESTSIIDIESQPTVETSSPVTPTTTAPEPKANPNPLHCRVCLADSCDDITASMCGHIFCNRCITDAVIKTSRCPVCMTPTLLYCLFRLDLAA